MERTSARSKRGPSTELVRRVAVVLLLLVTAFQSALAAGAPWGEAAWGGANAGTLPTGFRVASVASAAINGGLAALVGGYLGAGRWVHRSIRGMSVFFGLGVVMNAASPSVIEKLIWTPVTLALVVLLWRRANALKQQG